MGPFSANVSKYKHKTWYLMANIARIFPLDRNAVEILPIEKFSDADFDGLVLHFFISTSKFEPKHLHKQMQQGLDEHNKAQSVKSNLAKQIAKAWNLPKDSLIVYGLHMMDKSGTQMEFKNDVEMQLSKTIVFEQEQEEGIAAPNGGTTTGMTNAMIVANGTNGQQQAMSINDNAES